MTEHVKDVLGDQPVITVFKIRIFGSSPAVAEHYLRLNDADVSQAVNLFFNNPNLLPPDDEVEVDMEAGPSSRRRPLRPKPSNGAHKPQTPADIIDLEDDDEVRSPIPAQRGVLIDASFADSYAPSHRVLTDSVFDPNAGDFRAAAESQRARLVAASTGSGGGGGAKRRMLADLFRAPSELMFEGPWESAREAATSSGRWLLVNVQSASEFSCQTLNRDVWNNPMVQELVNANFVFWQVQDDTAAGRRFEAYYRQASGRPFVAIVDPRTGELLREIRKIRDAGVFCEAATEFLGRHPTFAALDASLAASSKRNGAGSKRKAASEAELDAKSRRVEAEAEDVRSRMETQLSTEDWTAFLSPKGRVIRFQVRFPDNRREVVEVRDGSSVKALVQLAASKGFPPSEFELVLNFPKRVLGDASLRLSALGLNPQEVLFVERR